MARGNDEIAAELDTISTTLSGPRAGALRRIAGELRGDGTTVEPLPNETRAAQRAQEREARQAAEAEAAAQAPAQENSQ